MARQSKLWLGVKFASVLILFVGLGAVMYRLGFFSFGGTDSSSKVVAAALALVGVIIGTAVSLFGVLLKHSIDERNADLRTDAEQRLRLEAAVRTLQLLTTTTGEPAPRDQRDGALVTLSSLGQYELTLLMAEKMIESEKKLNPNMFTTLLNGAILHGSEEIKEGAITLYHRHAARMLIPNGIAVPRALLMWQRGLPETVRERGAIAVAEAIMARPFAEWTGDLRFNFYTAVGILCLAWEKEKTRRLRDNFAVILSPLFSGMPAGDYLFHPSKKINIAKIKREVKRAEADSEYMRDLATQLLDWVNRKDGEKQVPEPTQSKDSDKQVSEPEQSQNSNKQRRAHRQGR